MSDPQTEARRRSAALFGNEKTAEVLLAFDAMSEPRSATATQLAKATDITHGLVREVLVRLTSAGLLLAAPKVGGSRSAQYYSPSDPASWASAVELARSMSPGVGVSAGGTLMPPRRPAPP